MLFSMHNLRLENSLDEVEKRFGLSFRKRRETEAEKDNIYFPQFDEGIRNEAASMAEHYEAFYCLEKTIRNLIAARLSEVCGNNWWSTSVPEEIVKDVKRNIDRELDAGVSLRSTEEIDYTTFGQLSDIMI